MEALSLSQNFPPPNFPLKCPAICTLDGADWCLRTSLLPICFDRNWKNFQPPYLAGGGGVRLLLFSEWKAKSNNNNSSQGNKKKKVKQQEKKKKWLLGDRQLGRSLSNQKEREKQRDDDRWERRNRNPWVNTISRSIIWLTKVAHCLPVFPLLL